MNIPTDTAPPLTEAMLDIIYRQWEVTAARLKADYLAARAACEAITARRIAAEVAGDYTAADWLLGDEMTAWEAQNAAMWDWQRAAYRAQRVKC